MPGSWRGGWGAKPGCEASPTERWPVPLAGCPPGCGARGLLGVGARGEKVPLSPKEWRGEVSVCCVLLNVPQWPRRTNCHCVPALLRVCLPTRPAIQNPCREHPAPLGCAAGQPAVLSTLPCSARAAVCTHLARPAGPEGAPPFPSPLLLVAEGSGRGIYGHRMLSSIEFVKVRDVKTTSALAFKKQLTHLVSLSVTPVVVVLE